MKLLKVTSVPELVTENTPSQYWPMLRREMIRRYVPILGGGTRRSESPWSLSQCPRHPPPIECSLNTCTSGSEARWLRASWHQNRRPSSHSSNSLRLRYLGLLRPPNHTTRPPQPGNRHHLNSFSSDVSLVRDLQNPRLQPILICSGFANGLRHEWATLENRQQALRGELATASTVPLLKSLSVALILSDAAQPLAQPEAAKQPRQRRARLPAGF